MLVPMRCILETTEQFGYACGAFNVNAVCQAEAAVRVHEIFHAPAILQGADLANGFMGGRNGKKPLKSVEQNKFYQIISLPCCGLLYSSLMQRY